MKDGTTHLAYKPEHAVDLDTGAVVAAELHPADEGDTTTLEKTLAAAKENLEAVDAAPTAEDPAECVTDKGYHSRRKLGAGTPREAVAGGYGCICVLIAPAGAVLVAQMVLIVSEDGETAFVALCFAVE